MLYLYFYCMQSYLKYILSMKWFSTKPCHFTLKNVNINNNINN